jgi:hypothetical protein
MTANSEYKFQHNGKKYSIPAFGNLPIGALRAARKATDDSDKAFVIIEYLLGEDSPEIKAIDTMNAAEFTDWLEGWTQGAQLGESSSSEN